MKTNALIVVRVEKCATVISIMPVKFSINTKSKSSEAGDWLPVGFTVRFSAKHTPEPDEKSLQYCLCVTHLHILSNLVIDPILRLLSSPLLTPAERVDQLDKFNALGQHRL